MIRVPVELGARRYEVAVGDGARLELAAAVRRHRSTVRRAAVVTQAEVAAAGWLDALDPGVDFDVFLIPDGEGGKHMRTVEELCAGFARSGLASGDVVVALGGGVVTDVAGFAAASYHRGTSYVNVATTLLAQVDAAVGGKTGVNLAEGKNLVGAFWQPAAVLCDTATLVTLPPREWACGRGEMAKYALLDRSCGEGGSLLDMPVAEQVARCVEMKAEVVAQDEHDSGRRMVLNYGHTLAHALEAAALGRRDVVGTAPWDLRHGEAVAIGLVFAALLARRLGRIGDERVAEHRRVVAGFDLSSELPAGAVAEVLVPFMTRDKKAEHDLTFVLDGPRGIEPVHSVEPSAVVATLAEMGAA